MFRVFKNFITGVVLNNSNITKPSLPSTFSWQILNHSENGVVSRLAVLPAFFAALIVDPAADACNTTADVFYALRKGRFSDAGQGLLSGIKHIAWRIPSLLSVAAGVFSPLWAREHFPSSLRVGAHTEKELEAQAAFFEAELEKQVSENNVKKTEVTYLQKMNDGTGEILNVATKELNEKNLENEKLLDKIAQYEKMVGSQAKRIEDLELFLKKESSAHASEKKNLNRSIRNITEKLNEKEKQVTEQQERLNNEKEANEGLHLTNSELKKEVQNGQLIIKATKKLLETTNEKMAALVEKNAEEQHRINNELESVKQENKSLKNQLSEVLEQQEELRAKFQFLEGSFKTNEAKRLKLEDAQTQSLDKIETLKKGRKALKAKIEGSIEEQRKMKVELEKITNQLAALNDQHSQLGKEVNEAHLTIENLKKSELKQQSALKSLEETEKKQLETLRKNQLEFLDLQKSQENTLLEIQQLKGAKEQLHGEKAKLLSELKESKSELEMAKLELLKAVEDRQHTLDSLEIINESLESNNKNVELDALQEESQKKTSALEALQEESRKKILELESVLEQQKTEINILRSMPASFEKIEKKKASKNRSIEPAQSEELPYGKMKNSEMKNLVDNRPGKSQLNQKPSHYIPPLFSQGANKVTYRGLQYLPKIMRKLP